MWRQQSERTRKHSTAQERKETGRLEALSDGVFGIAMTLLVLLVPIPTSDQLTARRTLMDLALSHWPSFAAYAISFLTILVMWINHHCIFQYVARIDRVFVIVNGLLLMLVVFVNYPTALVANFISFLGTSNGTFAAAMYNATFVLIAILYNGMWRRVTYRQRLLASDADPDEVDTITRQYRFGGPLYLVAFGLAFVSPGLSVALDAALAIFFAFTGQITRSVVDRGAVAPVGQLDASAERPL